MKRAYFITGTDTGVGKTFVASGIAAALKGEGFGVGVMKPVETGCAIRNGAVIPADAVRLKEAAGSIEPLDAINPYRFTSPLAPAVAARLEGVTISLERIRDCFQEIADKNDVTIVEGAGGLLAPLTGEATTAGLVSLLNIPLIIVAPSRLGVINHVLLTVHAARSLGIAVLGVILNHPVPPDRTDHGTNRSEIERFSRVPVLGTVPFIKKDALGENAGGVFKMLLGGDLL